MRRLRDEGADPKFQDVDGLQVSFGLPHVVAVVTEQHKAVCVGAATMLAPR
jgi:hypothetical protein